MAKPNFGFKGDGITAANAMAAGASVTAGTYVYLTQLSAITPSTTYPPMASDPGSQSALFSSPSTQWTSLFGATTSTSGTASSPYSASFSGIDFSSCTISVALGTLRVTGTASGDTTFAVIADGSNAVLAAVGDYNGFDTTAINWTITGVNGSIRLDGSQIAASGLNIWLIPN